MATLVSRVVSLVTVAVVVATLNACTPKPNGPEPVAEKFFAALATGDTAAAAELSDKPADACQLVTKASKTACMKQILMLKALGGKRIVLGALPHDWKHQIEVAKVIVNGNTATMPGLAGGKGRLTQYQRVDGHWLVVVASS